MLRLHPPVPKDTKSAREDDTLPDGTFVPAGALVLFVPFTMARMQSIWGPDCCEFRPGRWATGEAAARSGADWGGKAQANVVETDKFGLPRIYAPDAYHAPIFQVHSTSFAVLPTTRPSSFVGPSPVAHWVVTRPAAL